MPKPKKSKKALVQFAVAGVVAVVVGMAAIGVTYMLVAGIIAFNEQERQKAFAEAEYLKGEIERVRESTKKEKVQVTRKASEVRALVDIPQGAPVTNAMLEEAQVEEKERNPQAFTRISDVVGMQAVNKIFAGEVMTKEKLAIVDDAYQIPKGMRAMTIHVDDIAALNGILVPGVYVDILITLEEKADANAVSQALAKTMLQRVKVIGVGKKGGDKKGTSYAQAGGGGQPITLAVSPQQAEQLALASRLASFHLVLRGFDDASNANVYGADIGQLVTGLDRGALMKNMPKLPESLAKDAEVLVSDPNSLRNGGSPSASGNSSSGGSGKTFKMEIYKGGSSEEMSFQSLP
ncbi:MAG: Flp pilus assembly protein CpaB [Candidatus Melainabacteria bacterium]|nr:Flp pilus assembly protein CpaB [Candidatus Melainabacteria bacterium]